MKQILNFLPLPKIIDINNPMPQTEFFQEQKDYIIKRLREDNVTYSTIEFEFDARVEQEERHGKCYPFVPPPCIKVIIE